MDGVLELSAFDGCSEDTLLIAGIKMIFLRAGLEKGVDGSANLIG